MTNRFATFRVKIACACLLSATAAGCIESSPPRVPPQATPVAAPATTSVPPVQADNRDIPLIRTAEHRTGPTAHFVRFAQCQIAFDLKPTRNDGLSNVSDPSALRTKILNCVGTATTEKASVLVLPELSVSVPEDLRQELIKTLKDSAAASNMIIIAGSYYDSRSYSRLMMIGPGWVEEGYKLRPSRFEASPKAGLGMTPSNELLVVNTDFGRLAVITCVDLISDGVQFVLRNLATRGLIDVIVNINYNPSAWEFLIEANSIVRRHPVFASITNVSHAAAGRCLVGTTPTDNGYCYGNTAIFASLRTSADDAPNSATTIVGDLSRSFVEGAGPNQRRALPYDNLAASLNAFDEGVLIYELNLRLNREPLNTNAPDQGYPPIRGIKQVSLAGN